MCFWIPTEVVYLQCWHGWCHIKLLPSWSILCTPYNHALSLYAKPSKVHVRFAVTCHLYFWQNDQAVLRATTVIWGWNGYRNKSQHRKLTLEKNFFPVLLQGLEPTTFQSRVRRSKYWAIPTCSVLASGCQCWLLQEWIHIYPCFASWRSWRVRWL